MKELLQSVISNILIAFYQPFWFSLLLSVVLMFVWKNYRSVKEAVKQWGNWFRAEKLFRKMFFLTFYTVMILFRTLLNRSLNSNPTKNVVGVWGLHTTNSAGEVVLTTEAPENLILFIPFIILLFWTYRDKLLGESPTLAKTLWQAGKIVFCFSLSIETLQLFLRIGTWQLSDLFDNTLGGLIGAAMYWIVDRIQHRQAKPSKDQKENHS